MRIVSLIPSATEIVVALGRRTDLVGVTHSCDYPSDLDCAVVTDTTIPKGAPSREIDAQVKASLASGAALYDLDTELLEELEPDIILTQSVCEVCAVGEAQTVAGLDGLAIAPRVLSLHPHRLEDVFDDIALVGDAIGAREAAADLLTRYRTRVERVRQAVAEREPIAVCVLEWTDPPFSAGHWTPDLVDLAGGREVVAAPGTRSRELSWDEVGRANPAAIVLACCGHDVHRTAEDLDALRDDLGFTSLAAVRADRVFLADGGSHFSRPGPRLIDALELLAATIHPEVFPELERLTAAPALGHAV